jgi:formate dehydrogenase major subunit
MARRDNADPTGIGNTLNWAWAWPANRRVLYNRASCDVNGKPFNPKRKLIGGTARPGAARTCRHGAHAGAGNRGRSVHHEPRGRGALLRPKGMAEGPFPEHYEPFDTPLGYNPMHPNNPKATNPAARVFKPIWDTFGKAEEFPHVGTTYRLTEHFHYWTKHALLNAITQPEQFVEIGEALARAGHRRRRQGQGLVQARLHQGRGGGDQAHQAAESRASRCTTSASPSTGASRA